MDEQTYIEIHCSKFWLIFFSYTRANRKITRIIVWRDRKIWRNQKIKYPINSLRSRYLLHRKNSSGTNYPKSVWRPRNSDNNKSNRHGIYGSIRSKRWRINGFIKRLVRMLVTGQHQVKWCTTNICRILKPINMEVGFLQVLEPVPVAVVVQNLRHRGRRQDKWALGGKYVVSALSFHEKEMSNSLFSQHYQLASTLIHALRRPLLHR